MKVGKERYGDQGISCLYKIGSTNGLRITMYWACQMIRHQDKEIG